MLSVCLRAGAVIAVIFFQSPHRASEGGTLPAGLRRGLDAFGSSAIEAAPLARLWSAMPSGTRKDAMEAVAQEAPGAVFKAAAAAAERASGSDPDSKPAGPAWQSGPVREARRIYP